jgi:hypothetical protein
MSYASSIVNKLKALLADDARVIIYNRHVFIVQATGGSCLALKCKTRPQKSFRALSQGCNFPIGTRFHLSC